MYFKHTKNTFNFNVACEAPRVFTMDNVKSPHLVLSFCSVVSSILKETSRKLCQNISSTIHLIMNAPMLGLMNYKHNGEFLLVHTLTYKQLIGF